MQQYDLLSVGEVLIDFIPGREPASFIQMFGGAPANVAIAVARNGLKSAFCGMVGDDDFGHFIARTFEANKVEFICPEKTREAVTTLAFVQLSETGERSFTFVRKPGADMFLRQSDLTADVIARTRMLNAGSYTLSRGISAATTAWAIREARQQNKWVTFDFNYREHIWEQNRQAAAAAVQQLLDSIDILKVSEEEVDLIGMPIDEALRSYQLTAIVETMGADGVRCHLAGGVIEEPGRAAKVVDTTGAGDAFWGGFLAYLLAQPNLSREQVSADLFREALRRGNIAGWLCVQQKGAIEALPTREEIERYL